MEMSSSSPAGGKDSGRPIAPITCEGPILFADCESTAGRPYCKKEPTQTSTATVGFDNGKQRATGLGDYLRESGRPASGF